MSAQGVGKNQPAKLAAFEGLYQTTSNAPLTVIGWVDEKNEQTHGLQIPGLLSFLDHNNFHTPVTGLDAFTPEDRPPVTPSFLFFHGMVAIGTAQTYLVVYLPTYAATQLHMTAAKALGAVGASRGLFMASCARPKVFPKWCRRTSCSRR